MDALTGLMDRLSFFTAIRDITPSPEQVVMAVSLSRFANVSDSMGAELGDKIIRLLAKRVSKSFPNASAIGRTNGNHFVLFFDQLANDRQAVAQLQDFAQRPLLVDGKVVVLSVNVGMARGIDLGPDSGQDLLHAAEIALHRAKKDRVRVCYYKDEYEVEAKREHQLENDLRLSLAQNAAELHAAMANKEFELVYQPIVSARGYKVHACEALLRWNHPRHGWVSPSLFIPLAEQISIMDVLGTWVIRKACRDAVEWPCNSDGSFPGVSINVSQTQFIEPGILINAVATAIEESGIDPARLSLELTESAAFSESLLDSLLSLRRMGCKIGLDDFGTGHSSLTQLHILPLDYLKIDRSFIKDLCSADPVADERCQKMTQVILKLCDVLSLVPIVEGIETESQLDRVSQLGAPLIQGFYYSKPLAQSAVAGYVEKLKRREA